MAEASSLPDTYMYCHVWCAFSVFFSKEGDESPYPNIRLWQTPIHFPCLFPFQRNPLSFTPSIQINSGRDFCFALFLIAPFFNSAFRSRFLITQCKVFLSFLSHSIGENQGCRLFFLFFTSRCTIHRSCLVPNIHTQRFPPNKVMTPPAHPAHFHHATTITDTTLASTHAHRFAICI